MLLLSLLIDWHPQMPPAAFCAAKTASYTRLVQAIVVDRSPRSFDTTVLPLEDATADLHDELAPTILIDQTGACEHDLRATELRANALPQLYAAVQAAGLSDTAKIDVDRKLMQRWLVRLKLRGATLPNAKRSELLEREIELLGIIGQPDRAQATRSRIAHLLGYESWADYALADDMVQDPMRVEKFLQASIDTIKPEADREASAQSNTRRRRRDANDPLNVRRYFEAKSTMSAALDVLQTLLGVKIEKDPTPQSWSASVPSYSVSDAPSGRMRGSLFIDLTTRNDQAADLRTTPVLRARVVNGRPRDTAVVIAGTVPDHLLPTDLVTVLYALGDAMQTLLAESAYETLSEDRSDFADAPAQTISEFAWQPETLKRLSPDIPDDAIARIVTSRTTTNAMAMMQALDAAQHDLEQGSATLYAPLWEHVYASDLFTAFSSGTVLDPAIGMRFRQTILAPAGSLEPDAEVQNFLGRPMNPDAFYKEYTP